MLATTSVAALWFLPFAVAISIWVAWSDVKLMKIPNVAVYALVIVFAAIGLIALPFSEYLWRWTHLVVILAIGFGMNMARLIGAGDAKFAAAMAPFVAAGDMRLLIVLFAACVLGAFASHRLLGMLPAFRRATTDWLSWAHKDFPMGLALGGTLIGYLALGVAFGR